MGERVKGAVSASHVNLSLDQQRGVGRVEWGRRFSCETQLIVLGATGSEDTPGRLP